MMMNRVTSAQTTGFSMYKNRKSKRNSKCDAS
jgi:hypothetical protein